MAASIHARILPLAAAGLIGVSAFADTPEPRKTRATLLVTATVVERCAIDVTLAERPVCSKGVHYAVRRAPSSADAEPLAEQHDADPGVVQLYF